MAERRQLLCNHCDGEFARPNELPTEPVFCPYCERRVCGCGCGADLTRMKANAIYEAESHWKRLKRTLNTAKTPTRSVAEARALQEDGKPHWTAIADEGIYRAFAADPGRHLHADDLRALGLPLEHCNVIPSAMAKWVNRGYMVKCGERRSEFPSRNSSKSNEYRLTEKGRDHIAGDGAGVPKSQDSGDPAGKQGDKAASAVAGDEDSSGREAVVSSAASRPGESGGGGQQGVPRTSSYGVGNPAAASPDQLFDTRDLEAA